MGFKGIVYKTGDILDSNAEVLVNPVNCRGVMGKGLALAFKNAYPAMARDYRNYCLRGYLTIGRLHTWYGERIIVNLPTKMHWRDPSKLEYIEAGLAELRRWHCEDEYNVQSIALPKLGCGEGGLDWVQVQPLMEEYLAPLDCRCEIYV